MINVIPAGANWREAALDLLYGRLSPVEREHQLALLEAAIERSEFSLDHLLVAIDGNRLRGMVLGFLRPGGAAFLWPPVIGDADDPQAVGQLLLAEARRRFDAAGALFTQCLIESSDRTGRSVFTAGGFPWVTDMLLYSRDTQISLPPARDLPLSTVSYSDANQCRFADVIEETYRGTLDCPLLTGLRRGTDSLAAHRGTGPFDPLLWQLFQWEDRDVGILLMTHHADRNVWEVTYLGVVPEARGHRIGRAMLRTACTRANLAHCACVEVAVDSANSYAVSLYEDQGFALVNRYAVHLRLAPAKRPEPQELL